MGSQASRPNTEPPVASTNEAAQKMTAAVNEQDDEPDEWDKRIYSTGCADENARMTDCYFEKKDWRACSEEMEHFKQCWRAHGNDQRTATKDV